MPRRLLVHAVNQVHGALGIMALEFRLNPDGEELRSQIALLDLVEIDVAFGYRRVLAQIEVFVEKALGRVGMRINDQGRLVDGQGWISLRPRYGRGLGGFLMWRLDVVRALSLKAGESSKRTFWLHSLAILSASWFASRHSV